MYPTIEPPISIIDAERLTIPRAIAAIISGSRFTISGIAWMMPVAKLMAIWTPDSMICGRF